MSGVLHAPVLLYIVSSAHYCCLLYNDLQVFQPMLGICTCTPLLLVLLFGCNATLLICFCAITHCCVGSQPVAGCYDQAWLAAGATDLVSCIRADCAFIAASSYVQSVVHCPARQQQQRVAHAHNNGLASLLFALLQVYQVISPYTSRLDNVLELYTGAPSLSPAANTSCVESAGYFAYDMPGRTI